MCSLMLDEFHGCLESMYHFSFCSLMLDEFHGCLESMYHFSFVRADLPVPENVRVLSSSNATISLAWTNPTYGRLHDRITGFQVTNTRTLPREKCCGSVIVF